MPAFTDSELGLDVALNNRLRESTGRHKIRFDPFLDLEHFAATLLRQKKLGILTIGGGVPRNWSQQFGPFLELRHRRLGENIPLKRYHYGVRICPEPVYWGGLSGSPYSEAISYDPTVGHGQLKTLHFAEKLTFPIKSPASNPDFPPHACSRRWDSDAISP